jgi:hypothetical protein
MSINGRKVSAFKILRIAGLHVRVKSDLAERVRKIAQLHNITPDEAATLLVAKHILPIKTYARLALRAGAKKLGAMAL